MTSAPPLDDTAEAIHRAAMIDRILDRCALLGATPAQGRIREGLNVSFELRSVPVHRMSFIIIKSSDNM